MGQPETAWKFRISDFNPLKPMEGALCYLIRNKDAAPIPNMTEKTYALVLYHTFLSVAYAGAIARALEYFSR